MENVDRVLRQITKIRDVASGQTLPYVGRSRVGRLVFALNALVGEESGGGIALIGRRIQDIAKTICQPSEPLDNRWRHGWSDLLSELNQLESLLRSGRELQHAEQGSPADR